MSVMPQASLERLLEGVDWSRCYGRELHRLAEGAAQAAMRGEGPRAARTRSPSQTRLDGRIWLCRPERAVRA